MEVADLRVKFSAEGADLVQREIAQTDRGIDALGNSAEHTRGRMSGLFTIAGGFALGQAVFEVGRGILGWAGGILQADASAEQMRISLETVTGSQEKANALFKDLQAFAAATPFAFPELVQSAINLEGFGLKTQDWLTTIGDTASAMGKSVDQVTQAVLDAQTGEFERLKELNIVTKTEGDKVLFRREKDGQYIWEAVDKNNQKIINSTIQSIWNDQYAGAMEKQSHTFNGQWSTLKDNISMRLQEMSGGIFGFATSAIGFLNDIFANGFLATVRDTFGGGVADFLGNIGDMAQGVIDAFGEGSTVSDIVAKLPASWQPVASAILRVADALGDLWSAFRSGGLAGLFHQLWSEGKQIASAGFDLGEIAVRATFKWASGLVGGIYEWVKVQLFGGGDPMLTGLPVDNGMNISIGDVLIAGSLAAAGQIAEWAGDIWGWVEKQLGIGGGEFGDGTGGPDAARTFTIGDFFIDGTPKIGDGLLPSISSAIVTAIKASASLASDVAGAVWDQITSFQWASIITVDSFNAGQGFTTPVHDAIVGGIKAAIDQLSDLSADDCLNIIESIGAGIAAASLAAPAAIVTVSTAIASFVAGAITGLVFGDDVDFGSVATKIVEGIQGAIDGMTDFAITLATWDLNVAIPSIGDFPSLADFTDLVLEALLDVGDLVEDWQNDFTLSFGLPGLGDFPSWNDIYNLVWNGLRALGSLSIGWPNSWSIDFPSPSINIPFVGNHAAGGLVDTPLQWVGERGPELVSLPMGSRVYTSSESLGMMRNAGQGSSGGGPTYIFVGNMVGGDIERFIDSKIANGTGKRVDRGVLRGLVEAAY